MGATASPPRRCATRSRSAAFLGLALVCCTSAAIPAQPRTTDPIIGRGPRGPLGEVLTADGMTVYVFTKDRPGETVCYEICALNWPPLLVTRSPALAGAFPGRFGSLTRRDGVTQLTYRDLPLYRYIEDPPGTDQANGQDVDHEWFVARP